MGGVFDLAGRLRSIRCAAAGVAGMLKSEPNARIHALATVGVLLGLFALVPGLPFVPFLLGSLALGGAAFWVHRKVRVNAVATTEAQEDSADDAAAKSLGDMLDLDDVHVDVDLPAGARNLHHDSFVLGIRKADRSARSCCSYVKVGVSVLPFQLSHKRGLDLLSPPVARLRPSGLKAIERVR